MNRGRDRFRRSVNRFNIPMGLHENFDTHVLIELLATLYCISAGFHDSILFFQTHFVVDFDELVTAFVVL